MRVQYAKILGNVIFNGLCKTIRQGNSVGLAIVVAVALFCWWSSPAWAAGFALVQQGTAAMAQGNAFVAEANDASAVFYNPAGLNQLKRIQVYQGTFLNYPDREFSGGGQDSQTNHRIYDSMTAYVAIPVHDRVPWASAFFRLSGWARSGRRPGQGISHHLLRLKTYCLNPVASFKVLDNLSLAAGVDVMWSKVQLKRKTPTVFRGRQFPDGEIV